MRRRISKTLHEAKRRCRAQLLAKGSQGSQVSAMRSKQVWKEPKLVSVTLLLCPCINNHPLFMALHITPYTCLQGHRGGQGRAGCRGGTKGPSQDPEISPAHPSASGDVDNGRVSAQLFPHLLYHKVTPCSGTRGSGAGHGLEQAALDHSQGKAALGVGSPPAAPEHHLWANHQEQAQNREWSVQGNLPQVGLKGCSPSSPQKHTETTLMQAGCWAPWGSCPQNAGDERDRGQCSGCFCTGPCSRFHTWPSPSWTSLMQGNLHPQLPPGPSLLLEPPQQPWPLSLPAGARYSQALIPQEHPRTSTPGKLFALGC